MSSVLTRMCRINGFADFCDIAPLYSSDTPCISFVNTEIDLPAFCRRTNNAYGEPLELLENFTWLRFSNRLGGVADEEICRISIGSIKPVLSHLTFPDLTTLRFCPTCRRLDVAILGVSYWRRVHQWPVVYFCPTHGDQLVSSDTKLRHLHQSFPLPGDCVSRYADSVINLDSNTSFWMGVSSIAGSFSQEQFRLDDNAVRAVILDGLRGRGLAKRNGNLQVSELIRQLAELVGELPAELLSINQALLAKRIVQSINEPRRGIAFGRLVLVYWLFGNWDSFLERCRWSIVFGNRYKRQEGNAKLRLAPEEKFLAEYHKGNCITFIQEHPDCSRLQFTRAEYRSFHWLLLHDPVWLDQTLPVPIRRSKQLCLFN